MSSGTPDELLAQAHALETEASSVGAESRRGRELRTQAAALRLRALGEKLYPAVICSSCFRITGWVDAAGRCDACLRSDQLDAAYSDPDGDLVLLTDRREPVETPDPLPFAARLAALVGRRCALERAKAAVWLKRVDPDHNGPIAPEDGYEIEVAQRDEIEAADGSGVVIRFSIATNRFVDGAWIELATSKIVSADLLVPTEFSAGLPFEQLAEAWADYRGAVELVNRTRWERLSQSREAARQARETREEALRRQQDVSELLDEG